MFTRKHPVLDTEKVLLFTWFMFLSNSFFFFFYNFLGTLSKFRKINQLYSRSYGMSLAVLSRGNMVMCLYNSNFDVKLDVDWDFIVMK